MRYSHSRRHRNIGDHFSKLVSFALFFATHDMVDLAFGWLLAQPVTASVIAGATSPEQAEQNVRAGAAKLAPDVLAELDRITR